jgi:hypothetical protein
MYPSSRSRATGDSERLIKQTYSVRVSLPDDRTRGITRKWHLSTFPVIAAPRKSNQLLLQPPISVNRSLISLPQSMTYQGWAMSPFQKDGFEALVGTPRQDEMMTCQNLWLQSSLRSFPWTVNYPTSMRFSPVSNRPFTLQIPILHHFLHLHTFLPPPNLIYRKLNQKEGVRSPILILLPKDRLGIILQTSARRRIQLPM